MEIKFIDSASFHEDFRTYLSNGFDVAPLDSHGKPIRDLTDDATAANAYATGREGASRLGFRGHIEQGASILLTVYDYPDAWVNLDELAQSLGWFAPLCLGFVDKVGTRYLPLSYTPGLPSMEPGARVELVSGVNLQWVHAIPAPRQWRCGALGLTRFTPVPKSCDFPQLPANWVTFAAMRHSQALRVNNPTVIEFLDEDPRAGCDPELWAGWPEERISNGANTRELFRTLRAQSSAA